jgi:pimeloyl-ACP methyl ester carboxylesterase
MPDQTSRPVHRQATRRVALQFDEHGNPMFATVCSPESFKVRALAVPPRRHVIPVIFVPGIMGSNLRATQAYKQDQPPAWHPPNGTLPGIKEWNRRRRQLDAARQLQLTPAHCEVDRSGEISLPGGTYTLTADEARRRGWGELHWESYGTVLPELERLLNDQYADCGEATARVMEEWKTAMSFRKLSPGVSFPRLDGGEPEVPEPVESDVLEAWRPVKGRCEKLTEAEFARLDDYFFPVWACGYNWLESNELSARRLVARIGEVLDWYGRPECDFIPEGRVILVTHSMGGLVARRAAQLAEERVLGVVHGVQPVGGAPAVYRRFRAGTEAGGFWDIEGRMVARILGSDAASITCVMANAPGPLELLPTRDYPPGWLRFEREANGRYEELAPPLPQADPYEEIYAKRVQDVWWGMVDETLIDPAELAKGEGLTPFESYDRAITAAMRFHDRLGLYFHPQTYAHYGSDKEQVSFGAVRWVTVDRISDGMKDALMTIQSAEWTVSGKATLGEGEARVNLKLDNKRKPVSDGDEDAGDTTVPRPSGRLVEDGGDNVKLVSCMKGFDHQGSYKHPDVLSNVTYCLGKLIQLATPIDQLPQTKGSSWSESSAADSAESASLSSPEPVQ